MLPAFPMPAWGLREILPIEYLNAPRDPGIMSNWGLRKTQPTEFLDALRDPGIKKCKNEKSNEPL